MKIRDIFLTLFFCCFLGIVSVAIFLLPASEISVHEKRVLQKRPEFSLGAVLDGSYEEKAESYISDHFPFRELLVSANSYAKLYTGQNGINGIYKGKDNYLMNIPVSDKDGYLSDNMTAVNEFTKKTGIKSSMMIVPTTGGIMSDKLPKNHLEYYDNELISKAQEQCSNITFIGLYSKFKDMADTTQLYYKTDHHWTTEGAYAAYVEYCESILHEQPMWDFDVERYKGFYGTTYSKSALWNEPYDMLEIWKYPLKVSVEIDGEPAGNSMIFTEHTKELDMYEVFLDGNHAIEKIKNYDAQKVKKLLVIKDSFAHALVPFLIKHYSEIVMIDPRYYFDSVSELCDENNFDEILYIAGLASLCENDDFTVLE